MRVTNSERINRLSIKKYTIQIAQVGGRIVLLLVSAMLFTWLFLLPVIVYLLFDESNVTSFDEVFRHPLFLEASMWAQFAGIIFAVIMMSSVCERTQNGLLGFTRGHIGRHVIYGMWIGFLLITVVGALIFISGSLAIVEVHMDQALFKLIAKGFMIFIAVSLSEELFCRGYLQGLCRYQYGSFAGIWIPTAVFAGLHVCNPGVWDSPLGFINLLLAGIMLGICRERTGTLWMPIGIHLTWNFVQGYVYGFQVSGQFTPSILVIEPSGSVVLSGGEFGAEGSLYATIVLIACIVYFYKYDSSKRR